MLWLLLALLAVFGGLIVAQKLTLNDQEKIIAALRAEIARLDTPVVLKGPETWQWHRGHSRSRHKPRRRDW